MRGVNQRPLPLGIVTNHPNGGLTVKTASGNQYAVRSNGTLKSFSSGAQTVNFRSNGRVAAIHRPDLDVRRTSAGGRTVVTRRAGGATLVSTGPHRGYLQRTTVAGNRTVIQRTYVSGGRTFTRAYLGYNYGGVALPYYVAGFYYPAAFYGWAYYGWPAPIGYAWGWTGDPWYGVNAGYFAPYATYGSGYAWLTDYVLAQTLAAGYADQMQAAQDADGAAFDDTAGGDQAADDDTLYAQADTPITPELKDEVAAEVQHQIAYESAIVSGQAQPTVGEFPGSLKPGRVFVVANAIDVSTPDDHVCSLTPGDVLRFNAAAEDSGTGDLRVASSHRQDCPAGITVTLSLADLQEMVNTLRAQLDAGLAALHADQGQGGLPSAPPSSMGAGQASEFAAQPADSSVGALIDQQRQDALNAETAAAQSAFPPKQ